MFFFLPGDSVFLQLWCAGVIFFFVNVLMTSTCLRHHRYIPLFDEKKNGALNMILSEKEEKEESEESEDGNSIGARAAARRRWKSDLSKEK